MVVPLYEDRAKIALSGNRGLLFDKLADGWTFESKAEFNKTEWIQQFAKSVGKENELLEYAVRYSKLITALGGTLVGLKNITRFVTGTGLQHPMENGFAWHRTLGVPYLPSSGFKGAVKSSINRSDNAPQLSQGFGEPTQVGEFIFFDLLPVKPPKLCVEILTPHYSDYYQNSHKTPGDWINPIPIPFLAVEANASWIFGIAPTSRRAKNSVNDLRAAAPEAALAFGFGAKTAIGMGGFEEYPSSLDAITREREKEERERQQQARLANADPELLPFIKLVDGSKDAATLWTQVHKEVEELVRSDRSLNQSTADWLRKNVVEAIKGNVGVWNNPDAVSGKKKQLKYSAKLIALTKLIQEATQKE